MILHNKNAKHFISLLLLINSDGKIFKNAGVSPSIFPNVATIEAQWRTSQALHIYPTKNIIGWMSLRRSHEDNQESLCSIVVFNFLRTFKSFKASSESKEPH